MPTTRWSQSSRSRYTKTGRINRSRLLCVGIEPQPSWATARPHYLLRWGKKCYWTSHCSALPKQCRGCFFLFLPRVFRGNIILSWEKKILKNIMYSQILVFLVPTIQKIMPEASKVKFEWSPRNVLVQGLKI